MQYIHTLSLSLYQTSLFSQKLFVLLCLIFFPHCRASRQIACMHSMRCDAPLAKSQAESEIQTRVESCERNVAHSLNEKTRKGRKGRDGWKEDTHTHTHNCTRSSIIPICRFPCASYHPSFLPSLSPSLTLPHSPFIALGTVMFRHRAQHGLPFLPFPLIPLSTRFIWKVSDPALVDFWVAYTFVDGMRWRRQPRIGTGEGHGKIKESSLMEIKTQCTLEMERRVPWMAKLMLSDPGVQ